MNLLEVATVLQLEGVFTLLKLQGAVNSEQYKDSVIQACDLAL